MSILGHDVDGRPLRAGDRVVILSVRYFPEHLGRTVTIVEASPGGRGSIRVDIPHPITGRPGSVLCSGVRRLDDRTDHQPSEYTFDSLMDHLKSGAPA